MAWVREGKIREDTLVWREGLPNWIPFHDAELPTAAPLAQPIPPILPPAPLNPNEVVCVECRNVFPIEETIPHGNKRVCAACKPVFLQKLAEGAKIDAAELDYAGFVIRLAAKVLDVLIVYVPFFVFMFLLIGLIGMNSDPRNVSAARAVLNMILAMCMMFGGPFVHAGFQTFFLGRYGATPGKMACRLRVVLRDGNRLSYGRAAGRAFASWLSGMVFCIGYLIALFDDQKRTLHDHICDTRVVLR